jgi:16S rRNA (guanine527-N7)-methyltransferase
VPLLAAVDGLQGVLLEPRSKRWAFLRRVVRELGIDARVIQKRFEELPEDEDGFDVVTCRAVADMAGLAEWARARLTSSGRVLLWTTAEGQGELQKLPGWRVLSCGLPSLERGRLVSMQPCFT